MNSKFFCHSCDKLVANATQESSGEYKCEICQDPYVEILSDKEEENDEMVIEDYNPETEQVLDFEEEEQGMDVEPNIQPAGHTTFNFSFNVNINGQNVFSSSSSSNRQPQPYSFVGGDRTEVRGPSSEPPQAPRRRQPQPYSHVFVDPAPAPPRPQRNRRQPPPFMFQPFQPMMFNFMEMNGFGPRGRQSMPPGAPRGFASQGFFFPDVFGHQGPLHAGANPRDYFQGNMNDLLARMHRQHEAENGKPPAAKSVIDMLPTCCLTKADADARADSCCAVCQDTYKEKETICKLPCGHEYHKDCVHPWLERHCTCPVCRHEVGESQPEAASQAV